MVFWYMMVCSLLVVYQHIGGTAVFIFWVEGWTLKMEGTGFSELLVTEMHIAGETLAFLQSDTYSSVSDITQHFSRLVIFSDIPSPPLTEQYHMLGLL